MRPILTSWHNYTERRTKLRLQYLRQTLDWWISLRNVSHELQLKGVPIRWLLFNRTIVPYSYEQQGRISDRSGVCKCDDCLQPIFAVTIRFSFNELVFKIPETPRQSSVSIIGKAVRDSLAHQVYTALKQIGKDAELAATEVVR